MTELNFASYVNAIRPALMKHSEKEDAALFLVDLFLAETFVYAMNRFSKPDVEETSPSTSARCTR